MTLLRHSFISVALASFVNIYCRALSYSTDITAVVLSLFVEMQLMQV